jgi:hypothetical protein
MNILTSIRSFLEKDFDIFFCDFEAFYLEDLLELVQGIISKKHFSISPMFKDTLIDLSHTTLTRFMGGKMLGVSSERIYANFDDIAKRESERKDPIGFVNIIVPII